MTAPSGIKGLAFFVQIQTQNANLGAHALPKHQETVEDSHARQTA